MQRVAPVAVASIPDGREIRRPTRGKAYEGQDNEA